MGRKEATLLQTSKSSCIACNIVASLIQDQIMKHKRENKLFSEKQFGYIDGGSRVLLLLVVLDKWTKIIDGGGVIDYIYCNFKKAFDKVPIQHLQKKTKVWVQRGVWNQES